MNHWALCDLSTFSNKFETSSDIGDIQKKTELSKAGNFNGSNAEKIIEQVEKDGDQIKIKNINHLFVQLNQTP